MATVPCSIACNVKMNCFEILDLFAHEITLGRQMHIFEEVT